MKSRRAFKRVFEGMAKSAKSERRAAKSDESSSGDRRAGSVGERSELAGTRDSGPRRDETAEDADSVAMLYKIPSMMVREPAAMSDLAAGT